MGLFENLGRKVEQFKQDAQEASRERAAYRCGDCGELVYGGRDDCPECGSDALVPRDGEAEDDGDSAEGATADETADEPADETADEPGDETGADAADDAETVDGEAADSAEQADETTGGEADVE
jgi:predicted  nucleic acid-binding Zn-ribbon protein